MFYTCLSGILFTGEGAVPAPLHAGIHHWAGTPPGRYTPLGRYSPWHVHPQQSYPPGQAGTPQAGTPPGRYPPLAQCMLGYGQQVGSTHPTGMQSCFTFVCLCMKGGLCQGRSLSRGVSVQRVSVQGVSVKGCLCRGDLCPVGFRSSGSLSNGVSVRETPPPTVKSGQYAFFWNAFLLISCFQGQNFKI